MSFILFAGAICLFWLGWQFYFERRCDATAHKPTKKATGIATNDWPLLATKPQTEEERAIVESELQQLYEHRSRHTSNFNVEKWQARTQQATSDKWEGERRGIKRRERKSAHERTNEWQSTRQRIFRRDNYTCRICKKKPAEQVHHLGYATGQTDSDYNWEHNDFYLLSVCGECHMKIHGLTKPTSEWEQLPLLAERQKISAQQERGV